VSTTIRRNGYSLVLLVLAIIVASCSSGSDVTNPTSTTATVRLYNGMTPSSTPRLNIGSTPYGSVIPSGDRGPAIEIPEAPDSAIVAVDNGTTSTVYARTTAKFPGSSRSSIVVFPSTTAFGSTRYPDTILVIRDSGSVMAGMARLRVVNATDAGTFTTGELGIYRNDTRLIASSALPIRTISPWYNVEPGPQQIRIVREWQTPYDAATRTVDLESGVSYTLLLTGTLDLADSWLFRARLFAESDQGTVTDFLIPPDVGNFQVVNAVIGIRNIDVKIDGRAVPEMAKLPFPNASGYVDLELGTHTLEVTANGSPLVNNIRTLSTLRSRKTMFVSGTLVPPNIVGLELSEPERAQDPLATSLRVLHLSPDSPLLDIAILRDTTEEAPAAFRGLEFRETSTVPGTTNQFVTVAPGVVKVVGYRAGTKTVVLPPTDVVLEAGQVRTLWVGGLLSSIGLHSVIHSK
jgi:hypothetical protein